MRMLLGAFLVLGRGFCVLLASAFLVSGCESADGERNPHSVNSSESRKRDSAEGVTEDLLCVPKYHHNCFADLCVEKEKPRYLSFHLQTRKDKVLLERCEPICSGEPAPVRFRRELNGFQTIIDDGSFVFILDENLDFSSVDSSMQRQSSFGWFLL